MTGNGDCDPKPEDSGSVDNKIKDLNNQVSEWKDGLESQMADLGKQIGLILSLVKASPIPSPPHSAPAATSNPSVPLDHITQAGVDTVPAGQSSNQNARPDVSDPSSLISPSAQPLSASPARKQLSRQDINANFLTFSRQNPTTWFSVTENRFEYLDINSDEDRYWITLKCLGPTFFDELQAFMPSLQPGNKYPALKAEILRKLAQSEHDKLDRLLRESSIGERTPLEYFNTVQSLAAGIMSKDAALRFWWKGLPTDIAISVDPEIHQLDSAAAVAKANRIAEFKKSKEGKLPDTSIAPVEAARPLAGTSSEVLARIEALVTRDTRSRQARPRRFKRSNSRHRPKSVNRDERTGRLCFYHYEFGDEAKRCRKPCAWKKKQPGKAIESGVSNQKNFEFDD